MLKQAQIPLNLKIIVPRFTEIVKIKPLVTSFNSAKSTTITHCIYTKTPVYRGAPRTSYTGPIRVYTPATSGCYIEAIRICASLCDSITFGRDGKCTPDRILKCSLLSVYGTLARCILLCIPCNLRTLH